MPSRSKVTGQGKGQSQYKSDMPFITNREPSHSESTISQNPAMIKSHFDAINMVSFTFACTVFLTELFLYCPESREGPAAANGCMSGRGVPAHYSASARFSDVCFILSISTGPAFSIFFISMVTLVILPLNVWGALTP